MTAAANPTDIDMSHASRWMAVLRIVVGLWFLKALWTKLDLVFLGGFFPFLGVEPRWIESMPHIIAKQAAENPFPWYKAFLENTVIPHATLYAELTAWGEMLVGVSLTLGIGAGLGGLGRPVALGQLRTREPAHLAVIAGISLYAHHRNGGAVSFPLGTRVGAGWLARVALAGTMVYAAAGGVKCGSYSAIGRLLWQVAVGGRWQVEAALRVGSPRSSRATSSDPPVTTRRRVNRFSYALAVDSR